MTACQNIKESQVLLEQAELAAKSLEHERTKELLDQSGRLIRNCGKSEHQHDDNENEQLSQIIKQGKSLRTTIRQEETDTKWNQLPDRMGSILEVNEIVVYVVHSQTSRTDKNNWKWGVGDGITTDWNQQWHPNEAAAQEQAEIHAREQNQWEQPSSSGTVRNS